VDRLQRHLNVGYYHVAFDAASDLFFDFLGLTAFFASSTKGRLSRLNRISISCAK
jgi:hypothetical protein